MKLHGTAAFDGAMLNSYHYKLHYGVSIYSSIYTTQYTGSPITALPEFANLGLQLGMGVCHNINGFATILSLIHI